MREKTYVKWINRKVRRKSEPNGPIGTVVEPVKQGGWWRVEWPGGKRTLESQASLIIVE